MAKPKKEKLSSAAKLEVMCNFIYGCYCGMGVVGIDHVPRNMEITVYLDASLEPLVRAELVTRIKNLYRKEKVTFIFSDTSGFMGEKR